MSSSDSALQSDSGSDMDADNNPVDTSDLARKRKREEAAIDYEVADLRSQLQEDGASLGGAVPTAAQQAQHLLDLQAAELLQAIAPQPVPRLDALLRSFHAALTSGMQHGTLLDWKAARGFCRDVGVMKKWQDECPLLPPAGPLTLLGAVYAMPGPSSPLVDVCLPMPAGMFRDKDHLNHRYHAKRAAYLATAVGILAALPQVASVEWTTWANDPRRPCALLTCNDPPQLRLRLVPSCPPTALKPLRLGPTRNSLRSVGQAGVDDALPPTPMYNHSILEDMYLSAHAHAVEAALQAAPNAPAAATMLEAWLRAQGLHAVDVPTSPADASAFTLGIVDGVSRVVMRSVLAMLLLQDTLAPAMSVMQMVRGTLQALADAGPAWAMAIPPAPAPSAPMRSAHAVVLLDASGHCNLAATMTKASAALVSSAAARSLALLHGCTGAKDNPRLWPEDAFASLFLTSPGPTARGDCWYRLTTSHSPARSTAGGPAPAAGYFCSDVPPALATAATAAALLLRGLGDRAVVCHAAPLPQGEGAKGRDPAKGAPRPWEGPCALLLSVQCNPATVMRVLDVGPEADDKAAVQAFRAFWGDKAELRRFKDGRICEAVVWHLPQGSRHAIPDAIVRHVVQRHMPGASIVTHADALDSVLLNPELPSEHVAAARQLLDGAFDRLRKGLMALGDDVLLSIVSVQPISPHLRQTAPHPIAPHPLAGAPPPWGPLVEGPCPRVVPAVDVLCQLEGSGRWPADDEAYTATKALMATHIASMLHTSLRMPATASRRGTVDVLLDGFAFRLHVLTDRDIDQGAHGTSLQRQAWLHGLVTGMQARHASFAGATTLAACWTASHLLHSHLCHEAVELLMAAVYTALLGGGRGAPATPLAGLLAWLRLLAEHPFALRPVVVDVDGELQPEVLQEAWRAFQAQRDARPQGMVLVTPLSPSHSQWTAAAPLPVTTTRIAGLAAATLRGVERLLTTCSSSQRAGLHTPAMPGSSNKGSQSTPSGLWRALFVPALKAYDVVLVLAPGALPVAAGKPGVEQREGNPLLEDAGLLGTVYDHDPSSSNAAVRRIPAAALASRSPSALAAELLVGFDPVAALVKTLEQRLGAAALFFFNPLAPRVLCIKWRASAVKPHAFDPEQAHWVKPCGGAWGGVVQLDPVRVVAEVVAAGAGLVQSVH